MKKATQKILFTVVLIIAAIGIIGLATLQKTGLAETQKLLLTDQDLLVIGIASNGTDCQLEEYPTSEYSPLAQYGVCYYTVPSLSNTDVVIEFKKYTTLEDLNGTYQYESMHYRGSKGLLSQNTYGDQSRFYINNEDDYGAEYNKPGVYYYALYFCKNKYLVHVSSSGSQEAREYVEKIGQQILSKFD